MFYVITSFEFEKKSHFLQYSLKTLRREKEAISNKNYNKTNLLNKI